MFTINQYRRREGCLKWGGGEGGGGTWTVCRLNVSGGLARKSGVVFLSGVDTPVHTMLKEKDHITIKINGESVFWLAEN